MDSDPAIELEELIFKAAHCHREAVLTLVYHDWMTLLLKRLAKRSRERYQVDGELVSDFVFDQIYSQSLPLPYEGPRERWLDNPHGSSWKTCLAKWAYTVAKRRSLKIIEHRHVESRHAAAVEHEYTIRIEDGVRVVAPPARTPSPEEELERKEQAWVDAQIHEKTQQVYDSSKEELQRIVSLWASGMTLELIALALGSSIETVRRKLKKFQRAVVEEGTRGIAEVIGEEMTEQCGVEGVLEEIVTTREDLSDLLPPLPPVSRGEAPDRPDTDPEERRPVNARKRRRRRRPPSRPLAV